MKYQLWCSNTDHTLDLSHGRFQSQLQETYPHLSQLTIQFQILVLIPILLTFHQLLNNLRKLWRKNWLLISVLLLPLLPLQETTLSQTSELIKILLDPKTVSPKPRAFWRRSCMLISHKPQAMLPLQETTSFQTSELIMKSLTLKTPLPSLKRN